MASNTSPSGTFNGMTFTGVPLRTVFYFIAFMAVVMAIFYTIFVARRDHRRRVRDRARDAEAGRNTSTYRPETDEGKFTDHTNSPPGYRSHMLDQPYVDPEMVVIYPQDAHFGQHLNALERHLTMENSLSNRPLVSSVTTTTTTTTLATFMPGASGGVRSGEDFETTTEPVFVARPEGLVATSSLTGSSTRITSSMPTVDGSENSTPVIAEPAPNVSFFSGRHLSILRFGLRGSNNIYSGSSSHRNNRHSETSSPSVSRSPSPSPRSSMALLVPEATGDNQPQMAEVTSSSSLPHRALHRHRSQGPPPYIPSTEEAPALPPSYIHAVEVPQ
ncbi:hypothetical protein BG006_000903 [Podila minutissima]|uniref:Uncharacterized protein n=1 Tax=Podila minutissima TaxID=64525 RepID=A0A9P5SAW0_9FUNG|nr:hypothetical protein BG006_000903 [Podila minutissima]